jgi:uncharacterized membrane protein YgcG
VQYPQRDGIEEILNHYRRSLLLIRLILGIFGLVLALESYFLRANISIPQPNLNIDVPSNQQDYSSPGWSNDSSDSGGGWWDGGGGGDSNWDNGSWDSGGGGDSGSWDSGGGDSGSW